jgi:cell division protein FtsW
MIAGAALGIFTAHSIPESTLDNWSAQEHGILHRVPTWVHRITDHHVTPENPDDYDIYDNVQVTHAKIAIATCNLVGKGPGNSVERDYLPQAFSDFIYAIIIEEGGILSGAFVMFLYLLLMWRAMKIAKRCKALFPAYLVMGLALMMVVQAMINMAVAVGAFPVTGQPLPLISKGGTATFVNCAYIGMILSVSRSAKKVDEASNEQKKITTKAV